MSPLAILLSLGSGLAWAAVDVTRKRLGEAGLHPATVVLAISAGMAVGFGAGWALDGAPLPPARYALPCLIVVLANVAAHLLFMRSVTLSPLSKTIPFLAAHPVFTALFAIPLLGEWPSLLQWAGIGLVVWGALLVNASGPLRPSALWRDFRGEPGSPLMVAAGLGWAVASPFDKRGLALVSTTEHLFWVNAALGLAMLLVLRSQRSLGDIRKLGGQLGPALATVLLVTVAVLAQFAAYDLAPVALVETGKRVLGLVSALVLGRLVFAEPLTRAKLQALAALLAGIVCVVLG